MNKTKPVFVIGTGRCGTRCIYKMLKNIDQIDIFHEYAAIPMSKIAVLYHMEKISTEEAISRLHLLLEPAIYYSNKSQWITCDNRISWLIKPLIQMFPNASFIHIIRNGLKTTSSFYNKLTNDVYDDESVRIMYNYLYNNQLIPPHEKKYWWTLPNKQTEAYRFVYKWNRYQRICWHWQHCNNTIKKDLAYIHPSQKLMLKLENLTNQNNTKGLEQLLEFVHVSYHHKYKDFLKVPTNVIVARNFPLTDEEYKQFLKICTKGMIQYNYSLKNNPYDVTYSQGKSVSPV